MPIALGASQTWQIGSTASRALTVNGAISGTGKSLTISGAGALVLGGGATLGNLFIRGTAVSASAGTITTATNPISTVNDYSSIGQQTGDAGSLTLTGTAALTVAGDFNVADVSATAVLNVGGSAVVSARTMFVGKFGTSKGTVNQTGGTVAQVNNGAGTGDWRIGGGGSTSDAAAVGIYNLSAGTLSSGAANLQIGGYGTGTLTETGGAGHRQRLPLDRTLRRRDRHHRPLHR